MGDGGAACGAAASCEQRRDLLQWSAPWRAYNLIKALGVGVILEPALQDPAAVSTQVIGTT